MTASWMGHPAYPCCHELVAWSCAGCYSPDGSSRGHRSHGSGILAQYSERKSASSCRHTTVSDSRGSGVRQLLPVCEGGIIDRAFAPREMIISAANMPVVLLVGWHEPCAQPSPLDNVVEKRYGRTRRAEVLILTIQCAAFVVWWLIVGGFPLVRPRRWWLEPGALITVCTIQVALASLLIPDGLAFRLPIIGTAAMVPAVVVLLVWLWWFGLLIWKIVRVALRSFRGFRQSVAQ
jgi:hypothetical protein